MTDQAFMRGGELCWRRAWSEDCKAQLRTLFAAGVSDAGIAKQMGRTVRSIRYQRAELDLRRQPVGPWTGPKLDRAARLRAAGRSSTEIARALGAGFTRNMVIGALWRAGKPGVLRNQFSDTGWL